MGKPGRVKPAKLGDYEVVHTFLIMYAGWEMDNTGWVARDKSGKLVLLMTNHGTLYDYGRDVSCLHDRLKALRHSMAGIKAAIGMLNGEREISQDER